MRYEVSLIKKIYQEKHDEGYIHKALKSGLITDKEYAEIVGEFYVPTMDERRQAKLAELSTECSANITKGCDVELASGEVEHFSLTDVDQINLTNAIMAIGFGAKDYPYHADGKICKKYSAEDIQRIAAVAKKTIVYHTTYFNHLKQWIKREDSVNVITGIVYGAKLPEDLQKSFDEIVNG